VARVVLLIALLLALVGCAPAAPSGGHAAGATVPPPIRVEPPPVPAGFSPDGPAENEDGRALRIDGDGAWLVGRDIAAGFYRSMGPRPGEALCSWSVEAPGGDRSRAANSKPAPTVDAGVTNSPDGVQRVVLQDGETFSSGGCDTWVYYGP
jgi:hypothetical protein